MAEAGPLAPGQQQSWQVFVRVGLASAVGLVLRGLLLVLALRPKLRPVHDLATATRSAERRDLAGRIPEPPYEDQVAVLAAEFNRMLDRIQTSEPSAQCRAGVWDTLVTSAIQVVCRRTAGVPRNSPYRVAPSSSARQSLVESGR